jgi:hypothetical protein
MYLELGLATGTVLAAALVIKRWFRSHRSRSIEVGDVSGGWLAEQKMSKHNPNWP